MKLSDDLIALFFELLPSLSVVNVNLKLGLVLLELWYDIFPSG